MSIFRELNISPPDDVEPDNRTPSDSSLPAWLRSSPMNKTKAETRPFNWSQLMTPPPKRKCYVGMTMNLARRKREHESDYGEIHKWEWNGPYFSKTAAQEAENQLAGVRCHSNEGGRGDELAIWYVYSFEHEE